MPTPARIRNDKAAEPMPTPARIRNDKAIEDQDAEAVHYPSAADIRAQAARTADAIADLRRRVDGQC